MSPQLIDKLLYIFSLEFLINFSTFLEELSLKVRGEFFPIVEAFLFSFLEIAASVGVFLKNTNIVAISLGIASSIWIAKKAFKWFRQMCC